MGRFMSPICGFPASSSSRTASSRPISRRQKSSARRSAAFCSLAIDRDGKVLAGDSATREVYRFDQPGKPTPLIKGAQAGIGIPMALAVDSKGNIFVADLETHWIWKLAPSGGAANGSPKSSRGVAE